MEILIENAEKKLKSKDEKNKFKKEIDWNRCQCVSPIKYKNTKKNMKDVKIDQKSKIKFKIKIYC
jgi:protein subunit release factor B